MDKFSVLITDTDGDIEVELVDDITRTKTKLNINDIDNGGAFSICWMVKFIVKKLKLPYRKMMDKCEYPSKEIK